MAEEKNISMTLTMLAQKYEVSNKTMKKWIDKITAKKPEVCADGYIYTPAQVKAICEHLG